MLLASSARFLILVANLVLSTCMFLSPKNIPLPHKAVSNIVCQKSRLSFLSNVTAFTQEMDPVIGSNHLGL